MSAAVALAVPSKFVPSQLLELSLIEPDPHNPRKDFPKEALQELASSIAMHGVLSPIEVRPVAGGKFRIVFGERRFRAAKLTGLDKIPAIVRTLTDIQAAEEQLDENLKRAELSPLEVAGGYQRQLELGRTMDQVCERAGKKRSAVYATLQLLQLGPEGRKSLGEEKISASVAQLIARVPKALQPKALGIVEGGPNFDALSYREAEAQLVGAFTVDLKKAPFDTKDDKLTGAGSCEKCPKRTGNAKELYPDVKSPDVCTDGACYRAKLIADARRAIEAKGWTLLADADPQELFWNDGRGPLKAESGYVDPEERCHDDAQSRPYKALLQTDQLKKLVKVVLDVDGKPRQLLERAGLMREVKKGDLFKERKAPTAKASPAASAAPKEHVPPPPSVDELVDRAVVAKCVAVAEKKGPTPAMLKILAMELLALNNDEPYVRRGLKDPGAGRLSEKEFDKVWGKLSGAQLFGIVFEAAIGPRYMNGDGFDLVAGELGIDVKAVTKEIGAQIQWSNPGSKKVEIPGVLIGDDKGKPTKRYTDPERTTLLGVGQYASYTVDVYGANNVRLTIWEKNGGYSGPPYATVFLAQAAADAHNKDPKQPKWKLDPKAKKKDPLDSPAVAKAKAKKASAKKPVKKGGRK